MEVISISRVFQERMKEFCKSGIFSDISFKTTDSQVRTSPRFPSIPFRFWFPSFGGSLRPLSPRPRED